METCTYRAAPSLYGVLGGIIAAGSLLLQAALWHHTLWLTFLVALLGFTLVAWWLSRFRLTFGPEEITFVSPLREVRLARRDVLAVEFAEQTGRGESPTLWIRTTFGEAVRLNARVFPIEAVRRLRAVPAPARLG